MNQTPRCLALLAIAAQIFVGYCTWLAFGAFTRHWHETLAGKPLPTITDVSLFALRWIPFAFAIAFAFAFYRAPSWIAYILISEIAILSILLLGVGYPVFFITYRIY